MKLADHGQVKAALPQSDIPIGHLSWAIFLPDNLRVVDTQGNVSEVTRFTLPFRHFGDVAYEHAKHLEVAQKLAEAAQQALQQAGRNKPRRWPSARSARRASGADRNSHDRGDPSVREIPGRGRGAWRNPDLHPARRGSNYARAGRGSQPRLYDPGVSFTYSIKPGFIHGT